MLTTTQLDEMLLLTPLLLYASSRGQLVSSRERHVSSREQHVSSQEHCEYLCLRVDQLEL